jgi:hypothetical protein
MRVVVPEQGRFPCNGVLLPWVQQVLLQELNDALVLEGADWCRLDNCVERVDRQQTGERVLVVSYVRNEMLLFGPFRYYLAYWDDPTMVVPRVMI